ncbi:sigma-70 family RNA polymerase sigma factor [bacterium]|nr:sigma-70 family RNA polymerase sigma factor [bacterium]
MSTATTISPSFTVVGSESPRSDEHLLADFIAGNELAFDTLFSRFKDRIYRSALGLMTNEDDAEELTQDVFITLYRKGHQFKGTAALSSWLYRITHNLGKNMLLRRKLKYAVSLEWIMDSVPHIGASSDSSSQIDQGETMAEILKLIRRLDPLSRHILTLREINELSYEEISETTQLPLGTVKSRISRAKSKLQQWSTPTKIKRGEE